MSATPYDVIATRAANTRANTRANNASLSRIPSAQTHRVATLPDDNKHPGDDNIFASPDPACTDARQRVRR